MREILFRGKTFDGEWEEGSLHIEYGETTADGKRNLDYRILGMRGECRYVDPKTVVAFIDGGFCALDGTIECRGFRRYALARMDFDLEVIGNIHDNPELLEVDNGT